MKKFFLLSSSLELLKTTLHYAPPDWDLQLYSNFDQFYNALQKDFSTCILIDSNLPLKMLRLTTGLLDEKPELTFFYVTDGGLQQDQCPIIRIPQDLPFLSDAISQNDGCADEPENPLELLQGTSEAACRLREEIATASQSATPVLLSGQSGTGKTLAAHIIHKLSARKDVPFFAVNVATVPPYLAESELFGCTKGAFTDAGNRNGYFSAASRSSLFLDEISELEIGLQAKLLRVIETGLYRHVGADEELKTDARMIFATNIDLRQLVKQKLFRQDLFYRISKFVIHVPSLAERVEDIPAISHAFLEERGKRLTSDALRLLCSLRWNGNIRQLYNCLESASMHCHSDVIDAAAVEHACSR